MSVYPRCPNCYRDDAVPAWKRDLAVLVPLSTWNGETGIVYNKWKCIVCGFEVSR